MWKPQSFRETPTQVPGCMPSTKAQLMGRPLCLCPWPQGFVSPLLALEEQLLLIGDPHFESWISERELWSADQIRGNGPEVWFLSGFGARYSTTSSWGSGWCTQKRQRRPGSQPNQPKLSQLTFMEYLSPGTKYFAHIISFNPHNPLHCFYYSHFIDKETEA